MVLHFRLNSTKMMKLIGEARSVYRTQASLPKKPRGQQGDGGGGGVCQGRGMRRVSEAVTHLVKPQPQLQCRSLIRISSHQHRCAAGWLAATAIPVVPRRTQDTETVIQISTQLKYLYCDNRCIHIVERRFC
ncbi:hypothetical protein ACLKA6_005901 [Drosophila palustris]